jgi:lipid-A-disaccharide synthase
MLAEGCHALFPAEDLAVMGIVEVLGHLPRLLGIRRYLRHYFLANPPDVFVGIDAPDFNLGLERRLKAGGVPTVHYVSPSIWAWRQKRVFKVARATDLVLTLLPFEKQFYDRYGVPAEFVGHPLAEAIQPALDTGSARRQLGLPVDGTVVALLPGSRRGEVSRLGPVLLETARWLRQRRPDLRFVAPMASPAVETLFKSQMAGQSDPAPVTLIPGQSREAMAAADAVLLASGTAALECMLVGRPMVMAYKLAWLTHAIVKGMGMLKIEHYSLPNLLAGRALVPEFTQRDAIPEKLGPAVLAELEDSSKRAAMLGSFAELAAQLRQGADARAADAVLSVARGGR